MKLRFRILNLLLILCLNSAPLSLYGMNDFAEFIADVKQNIPTISFRSLAKSLAAYTVTNKWFWCALIGAAAGQWAKNYYQLHTLTKEYKMIGKHKVKPLYLWHETDKNFWDRLKDNKYTKEMLLNELLQYNQKMYDKYIIKESITQEFTILKRFISEVSAYSDMPVRLKSTLQIRPGFAESLMSYRQQALEGFESIITTLKTMSSIQLQDIEDCLFGKKAIMEAWPIGKLAQSNYVMRTFVRPTFSCLLFTPTWWVTDWKSMPNSFKAARLYWQLCKAYVRLTLIHDKIYQQKVNKDNTAPHAIGNLLFVNNNPIDDID